MKTSHTKLSSSLFLALAFMATPLFAKPVAQVKEVKGQVFVVSPDGKTKSLRVNDHIEERSEIMVGESGSITLNDYFDASYHLASGAHLKFFDKSVQLKKGKTWIRSMNSRHPLALTTANGHVDFWKGEFIATFDQSSSKSQFLVVNGEVEVSNILDKEVKCTVAAGNFTIVDPDADNGLPRAPTKVGLSSLNGALAEFNTSPAVWESPTPARTIASVSEEAAPVKKGKIIFISNGTMMKRLPASTVGGAHSYFKKKVHKRSHGLTSAPIRIFGATRASAMDKVPRHPASVSPLKVIAVPKKVGTELNMDPDFSESLRIEKASQPKHSKELENLIQDLKSY